MDRIGAISDVHGDATALGTVLKWLDSQGVTEVVCAGDIAGFGPRPNECIDMLVERGIRSILGNSDYSLLHPRTQEPAHLGTGFRNRSNRDLGAKSAVQ